MESDGDKETYLYTDTDEVKTVSNYINKDFEYCLEIDCYTFRKLLRNAFVTRMRESEDGRDYLKKAWMLTRTDMDVEALREDFGKGAKH